MFLKAFILICVLAAVLGFPKRIEQSESDYIRERRQLGIKFGGSSLSGFDVNFDGVIPILRNPDGSPRFGLSGSYSQHFGGPEGNGRPNINANAQFNTQS